MKKNFTEDVEIAGFGLPSGVKQGKVTRYTFSTKYKSRGLKIRPQAVVTIQQGKHKVKLERIQVERLYEMLKEKQEKLDGN